MLSRNKFRRPSLLWLSRRDVVRVRNQIVKLYLAPGETVRAAPPKGVFGIRHIDISCRGGIPCFAFELHAGGDRDAKYSFWLRCNSDKSVAEGARGPQPFWDCEVRYQVDESLKFTDQLNFDDRKALVPAILVKYFSRYFPFVPTENFLQNNGEFIA